MFKFIRHVYRGAGYLEGYGHHPGTSMLLIITLMGGLAGADKGGLNGFLGGCAIAFIFTLPLYIGGCVARSKGCDEQQARLLKKIKDA